MSAVAFITGFVIGVMLGGVAVVLVVGGNHEV